MTENSTTHKPVSEMTDAEINEFLATRLMGWKELRTDQGEDWWGITNDEIRECDLFIPVKDWKPAGDLNQAIECVRTFFSEDPNHYRKYDFCLFFREKIQENKYYHEPWKWVTATPRQHCEALIEAIRCMEREG